MNTGLHMKDAPMSLLTLRFSGDMEQAFLDEYFPKSLMQLRVALVVGLLLFASYGILDVLIVPENKKVVAWIIRYGIVTPVALALFLFTYARLFKHVMQVALTFLVLFVAAAVTAITVIAYPGQSFPFCQSHARYYVRPHLCQASVSVCHSRVLRYYRLVRNRCALVCSCSPAHGSENEPFVHFSEFYRHGFELST